MEDKIKAINTVLEMLISRRQQVASETQDYTRRGHHLTYHDYTEAIRCLQEMRDEYAKEVAKGKHEE